MNHLDMMALKKLKKLKGKLESKLKKARKVRKKEIRQGTTETQKNALFEREASIKRELDAVKQEIHTKVG